MVSGLNKMIGTQGIAKHLVAFYHHSVKNIKSDNDPIICGHPSKELRHEKICFLHM